MAARNLTNIHPLMIDMNDFNDSCLRSTNSDVFPLCSLTWAGSPIIDGCTVRADYDRRVATTAGGVPSAALHAEEGRQRFRCLDGQHVDVVRLRRLRLAALGSVPPCDPSLSQYPKV